MKKKYDHRIQLMAVLLLLSTIYTSCKKLIDIPPNPSALPQASVFADSVDAIGAMAGVYVYDFPITQGIAYHNAAHQLTSGLASDELAQPNNQYSNDDAAILANNILSTNSFINSQWNNFYTALYQVNVCLEGVQASGGISASLKQQLTGELEVTRALYYTDLVNLFGGVPLVTTSNYQQTARLPRSSVDAVYAQIVSDLTDAQKRLKVTYPSAGRARPNLYTATAVLARVYLYLGQWQNAYNAANQVISSGQYNLVSDLNQVFLDGSKEAIWQIPISSVHSVGTYDAVKFVPGTGPYSPPLPNYPVSQTLLNAFEPNDMRMQKWVGSTVVNLTTYYFPYKYKSLVSPTNEDYMMMRLSEQYLIRAEAAAHLGSTGSAVTDINIVRARAGLPAITVSSQSDVLAALMHERQVELFCEWDHRWVDLKRTGTVNAVLGAEKPNWKPYAALFPIPFAQTQLNTQLTQNPGYQ